MKIDIPKSALDILLWKSAFNLKNNNNLIYKTLRHSTNK